VIAAVDPATLTEACGESPSWICEQVLRASDSVGWAQAADFLLAKPLKIAVVLVVATVVTWLVRRAIKRFAASVQARAASGALGADLPVRTAARIHTLVAVLRSLATAAIFGLAFLTILGEIGINLGPLIAGAGVVGVAVGFGAQSLVKDFIAGFFMLIEDQYGVGDIVDVGEVNGTVEAVTLRSTRIRDVHGTVWHVPNGEIKRVGNKSQQWARAVLDVVVAHGTDVAQATEVLARVASDLREDPDWREEILEDPEVLGVEAVDSAGVTIRLVVKTQPASQFRLLRELRARVTAAFAAEGIRVPGSAAPPAAAASPPA
jgi:small-conductance mechanosensitive channel